MFFTLYDLHTDSKVVHCSVESVVEEVGLSQLLDRNIVGLGLSLARLAAAAALASAATARTLASTEATADRFANRFAYRRLSAVATASAHSRTRIFPCHSNHMMPLVSGCSVPLYFCSSISACDSPDISQACKNSSPSPGVASTSQSSEENLSLPLKSLVSLTNPLQHTPLSGAGPHVSPNMKWGFDVVIPAFSPGSYLIPVTGDYLALDPLFSEPHDVLPFVPPCSKAHCSSSDEPGLSSSSFSCQSVVSLTCANSLLHFRLLGMVNLSRSSVSSCLLSFANHPSSLEAVSSS